MDRMRTLNETYTEICKMDPNTSVSKNAIRRLALTGRIKSVMAGNRRLINLDSLIDYLGYMRSQDAKPETKGVIRKVPQYLTYKDLIKPRRQNDSRQFIEGDVVQIAEELLREIPKGIIGIVQFSKNGIFGCGNHQVHHVGIDWSVARLSRAQALNLQEWTMSGHKPS